MYQELSIAKICEYGERVFPKICEGSAEDECVVLIPCQIYWLLFSLIRQENLLDKLIQFYLVQFRDRKLQVISQLDGAPPHHGH